MDRKTDHATAAEQCIDEGLKAAQHITIEEALQEAVRQGRMTIKDSEECLESYRRAFNQVVK